MRLPVNHPRSGFTLIELMAALALTSVVLLGARALFDQLGESHARLKGQLVHDARDSNSMRLLHSLAANAERGDSTTPFTGTPTNARFRSQCLTAAGWMERCVVSLEVRRADSTSIAVVIDDMAPLPIVSGIEANVLAYFDPERGWLRDWSSRLTMPMAIGILDRGDTLVLRLGGGS
jgi:prepilin-type N-terminal cleavage/methylation domain-containing protein